MYVCMYVCMYVKCDGAAELHLDWDWDWEAYGRADSGREPDLSAVLIPYEDVCIYACMH